MVPKKKILRNSWPRVRWEPQRCKWVVDSRGKDFPNGKREFWDTPAEALASAEAIARQCTNDGAASFAELSPAERRDAAHALSILVGSGKNLVDAASALIRDLERVRDLAHVPTVDAAINAYLSAKRQEEISRLTLLELESKMRIVRATFGSAKLSDIDEAIVRNFVRKLPHRAEGKKNIRTKLSQFLNFCRREGKWIATNPAENVKVKVPRCDIEILSIDQVANLIRVAVASPRAQNVIPFVAVQLFAGLRPHEASGMRWEFIHFETGQLEVKAATSKTRESRFVPLEPILVEALLPYRQARGPIIGVGFKAALRAVKLEAGFTVWPKDVLRHCYGSYWLAVHKDRAHLAELMGNSLAVIKGHYRRAIPAAVAEEYWKLASMKACLPGFTACEFCGEESFTTKLVDPDFLF